MVMNIAFTNNSTVLFEPWSVARGFNASTIKVSCYVYLVTELNGITDNVTKSERQKSYTKFYYSINQNTVIT